MAVSERLTWLFVVVCGEHLGVMREVVGFVVNLRFVEMGEFRRLWSNATVLKYRTQFGPPSSEVRLVKQEQVVLKDRGLWFDVDDQIDNEFAVLWQSGLSPHPNLLLPFAMVLDQSCGDDTPKLWIHALLLPFAGQPLSQHLNSTFFTRPLADRPDGSANERISGLLGQLLYGLAHLHSHGIVHHDLCSQNLFVDATTKDVVLRIGDLGVAECVDENGKADPERRTCGHVNNLAPEQLEDSNEPLTTALDMYAFAQIANSIVWRHGSTAALDSFVNTVNRINDSSLTAEEIKEHGPALKQLLLEKAPVDEVLERFYGAPPAALVRLLELCGHLDPSRRPSAANALQILRK